MANRIEAIEEDDRDRSRRVTWGDVYLQCNPVQNDASIHKKELSIREIDLLDRTSNAVRDSLNKTEIAGIADPMRRPVSKTAPAGSNAVASAASSASITSTPKVSSVFDLPSSLAKDASARKEAFLQSRRAEENLQKGFDSFRKEVKLALNELDVETAKQLNEVFTKAQDPEAAAATLSAGRPRLAPPRNTEHSRNYMLLVLDLHASMEQMISDFTDHLDTQTQRDLKEMGVLREEKIKSIEEHVRTLSSQESWSTLANIARYFTFTSTAILGYTLGGPAGSFLMAAAALGIVNAAATDLGIWVTLAAYFTKSEEVQYRIAQQIDFALTTLSLGLALIGGVMAYQANALALARGAGRDAAMAKARQILVWFSAIFLGVTYCGKNWAERNDNKLRAEIERLEIKIFTLREQLKSTDMETQQTLKMAQIITEETARMIAASEVSLAN